MSLPQMMDDVGRKVAVLARALLGGTIGRRGHVLAGSGGNGGGGLVAARHLHSAGADVIVSMTNGADGLTPVTGHQLRILRRVGVTVGVGVQRALAADLVIDALLGYGQHGDPDGAHADLIQWCAGQRVLALDVPSGLELETGTLRNPFVRAEATLTLALPKHGLRSAEAGDVVGELFVADISVPPLVYERIGVPHPSPFGSGPVVRIAEVRH